MVDNHHRQMLKNDERTKNVWNMKHHFLCLVLIYIFQFIQCVEGGRDLYKALGVGKKATTSEIKKAYRKLSMKYHPDRNSDPGAADKFSEIAAAYEILSDDSKRQVYDRYGEDGLREHEQQSTGGSASDFFNFFGFGQRQARRGKERAPPTVVKLYLTLSQLYFGDLLQITYNRPVICLRSDECFISKKQCSGPGAATITQSFGPGFVIQNQISDATCVDREKGWKANCSACPHGPTEEQKAHTSLFIEKGMNIDDSIIFEGGGPHKMGYEPGDVVFKISQIPHEAFVRNGDHLHTIVYLTLLESLTGFQKTVPHLSNKPLVLKSDGVTHDGQTEKINKKGMPIKGSEDYGDLYIVYKIQFPVRLNENAKSLIKSALASVNEWIYEVPTPSS